MTTAQITTDAINLWRDPTLGGTLPTYIAIGTGSSTPAAGQHTLDAEVFRKAVAGYTPGASDGEVIVECVIGAGDAVGVAIAEVGWFGGNTAGATANSGIMIARGLYSHTKGVETLQLPLDLTF